MTANLWIDLPRARGRGNRPSSTQSGTVIADNQDGTITVENDDGSELTAPSSGITALGATVQVQRDASGRATQILAPTWLPEGADPIGVDATGQWALTLRSDLDAETTERTQQLASLSDDLSGLSRDMDTLQGDLSTAQTAISTTQTDLSSLTEDTRDAGRLTLGTLDVGRLNANQVAAAVATVINLDAARITTGTLSADRIAANSIDGGKIVAGAIGTDQLAANAVTAAKISAGAITADKFTGNSFEGVTITGATVRTGDPATSDVPTILLGAPGEGSDTYGVYLHTPNSDATGSAELVVTPTGGQLSFYGADGSQRFFVDSSGNMRIWNPNTSAVIDLAPVIFGPSYYIVSNLISKTGPDGISGWFYIANDNAFTTPTGRIQIAFGFGNTNSSENGYANYIDGAVFFTTSTHGDTSSLDNQVGAVSPYIRSQNTSFGLQWAQAVQIVSGLPVNTPIYPCWAFRSMIVQGPHSFQVRDRTIVITSV